MEAFDPEATRERLDTRTTGEVRTNLFAFFQSVSISGYVLRGGVDSVPVVVSVEADRATVRDCYDDTTGLYRIADGSRRDVDTPERHLARMALVLEDGVWKVAEFTEEALGCVP